ncbi:MAG: pyridoxal-phosphate dependent enzyme [Gemmatimonadaceae bacterium]|nr:pyridoxal-phosphate dependent enzyme [Gemmatimonadaceae bacterium]
MTAPVATPAGTHVERHRRPYASVLETIGWTPLIRLSRVGRGVRTPLYGKADFFNPGGSVKDRIGLPMIEEFERTGQLKPGGTIVEGTSGNTGVGLAIAAALKGYKLHLHDARQDVAGEGAPAEGVRGRGDHHADRGAARSSGELCADGQAHRARDAECGAGQPVLQPRQSRRRIVPTTGPELWEQTEGRITHFVAAAGTGGTISGVGRYLKEKNPNIRIIGADPAGSLLTEVMAHRTARRTIRTGAPYKVEGIGQDKVPGTLDMGVIDEFVTVGDRDAFAMARRLTREEGVFVGGSAGLIAHAALNLARRLDDPDAWWSPSSATPASATCRKVFNDEWMRENQMLDSDRATLGALISHKDVGAPTLISAAPGHRCVRRCA